MSAKTARFIWAPEDIDVIHPGDEPGDPAPLPPVEKKK